jgi:hypothetical protein
MLVVAISNPAGRGRNGDENIAVLQTKGRSSLRPHLSLYHFFPIKQASSKARKSQPQPSPILMILDTHSRIAKESIGSLVALDLIFESTSSVYSNHRNWRRAPIIWRGLECSNSAAFVVRKPEKATPVTLPYGVVPGKWKAYRSSSPPPI